VKNTNPIYWKLIGFGLLCVIVASSYLAVRDGSQFATRPQGSPDVTAAENSEQRQPTEESADSFAHSSSKGNSSIDGAYGSPGLSPDEIRILHIRQQPEVEQMLGDLDVVVIEPTNDGDMEITVRELLALHEQQKRELNSVHDGDEIVIAGGDDGSPARTVSELKAMHEQQEQSIETINDAGEIVIPRSEDGSGGISRAELTALHKRQRSALKKSEDLLHKHAAPLPEEGHPYLTVEELRGLHKSQSLD